MFVFPKTFSIFALYINNDNSESLKNQKMQLTSIIHIMNSNWRRNSSTESGMSILKGIDELS